MSSKWCSIFLVSNSAIALWLIAFTESTGLVPAAPRLIFFRTSELPRFPSQRHPISPPNHNYTHTATPSLLPKSQTRAIHHALSSLQGSAHPPNASVRPAHPNDQVRKTTRVPALLRSSRQSQVKQGIKPLTILRTIQTLPIHTTDDSHTLRPPLLPTFLIYPPLHANPPPTNPDPIPLLPAPLDIGTFNPVHLITAAPAEPLVLGNRPPRREAQHLPALAACAEAPLWFPGPQH